MKFNFATLALVCASLGTLGACASDAGSAATVSTLDPLSTPDYVTTPPVTDPPATTNPLPVVEEPAAETGTENTAAADATTTTTVASGEGCTYTIKPGDNPSKVAKKTGITYEALKAANEASGVLGSFLIGDTLVIPPPGSC